MFSCSAGPPPGREPVFSLAGRQLIWSGGPLPDRRGAEPDSDMVVLGKDDVPEMLDLVARTEPGPFRSPHGLRELATDTVTTATPPSFADDLPLDESHWRRLPHPPWRAPPSRVRTESLTILLP